VKDQIGLIGIGGNCLHLKEMMKEIEKLVKAKGHGDHPVFMPIKLLNAGSEVGEVFSKWRKGKPREDIAEEIMDVFFMLLDAWRLFCPELDPDEMFEYKLKKNWDREEKYGFDGVEEWKEIIRTMKEENLS